MTIITRMIESIEASSHIHEIARGIVSRILIPSTLTRSILQKYVRKAMRNRSWYRLPRLKRALLYAASKTIDGVRSRTLRNLLEEILLEIELAGTMGRAIYYGVIILMKQTPTLIKTLLHKTKQLLDKLLFLGISYLNNPPIYRAYG